MEVVCDLSKDTCPVDAVDSGETMGAVDFGVGKECLDDVLRELAQF